MTTDRSPVRGDTVRMIRHDKECQEGNEAAGLHVGEIYTVRDVYSGGAVTLEGSSRGLTAKEYELVDPEPDLDTLADTLREAGYTVEAPQPRYYRDGRVIHDREQEWVDGPHKIVASVWRNYAGDRAAFADGIADLANWLDTDTSQAVDEPEPEHLHDYNLVSRGGDA